jgi:hypothetical protein
MENGRWVELPKDFSFNGLFSSSGLADNSFGPLSLDQDPTWLEAITENGKSSFKILVYLNDSECHGYVPFFIHDSALQFSLGEVTFFSYPVKRFVLSGSPTIRLNCERDGQERLLESLFCEFPLTLPANAVFFLSEIPIQSRLFDLLQQHSNFHRKYYVLPHGPIYQRRTIDLSGNFEEYLKKLGSKTRQDLRRTRKKFLEFTEGKWQLVRFVNEQDVTIFLEHAESISKRTYQWNLLGLGVRRGGALEERLRAAALRGWFQGYVLFVKNQPLVFQVGYIYQGVYFAHDIGYDPDWAKYQLGIFLHTEIISDLMQQCPELKTFDFLVGDSLHKQRLSTNSHAERHFYLIPKTAKNFILSNIYRGTNWISTQLGSMLEKVDFKKKLKRIIRQRYSTMLK